MARLVARLVARLAALVGWVEAGAAAMYTVAKGPAGILQKTRRGESCPPLLLGLANLANSPR